jgi:iron complex transport system ATP-binding protein
MIKLDHISKSFANIKVIDDASIQFEKGKVTSIIGPNGAGKSTLLSMASRLINRDCGEVWIDGKELVDWETKELAKKLSVLRQANSVTMRFSVRELVAFGRFPYSGGRLTSQDQTIIDRSLAYLGIEEIASRDLEQLSGGQRQLAFIAMVIAQDTDYIFLDEPLNNLDIKHSLHIMQTLRRLAHQLNKAVVVVIHDINFASCYSDYIVALKAGKIQASGTVSQVITDPVLSKVYETPFSVMVVEGNRLCLYYTSP